MSNFRTALQCMYRQRMVDWENRLASSATDRIVRGFEWGLEWAASWPFAGEIEKDAADPASYLARLNEAAVQDADRFFSYETPSDFRLENGFLRFTSAVKTPYAENNEVWAQWFPARGRSRRAVLLLPHWNARLEQHAALCRILAFMGLSTLRLSLPYHDLRMPRELQRADYAVSSNVARTVDATRQAVIDGRSCLDWLERRGFCHLGITGTSLGSCYAFLTSAVEQRLRANVFNLFSLYFADVVWTGLTTRHIRQGIDGSIRLEQLRRVWKAISPVSYVDTFARFEKKSLFIYANCDTTFLPEYAEAMLAEIRLRKIPHKAVKFPCGHYTLGQTPFKFADGYQICSFLLRSLPA